MRDQWLGALYAPPRARDALLALAAFEHEIRRAGSQPRDPNLAALRLAWWRDVIRGERQDEAAGNPTSLALLSAIDDCRLPRPEFEAMLDARLDEIVPPDAFASPSSTPSPMEAKAPGSGSPRGFAARA